MIHDYEISKIVGKGEIFGDFAQHDRAKEILERIFERSTKLPDDCEYQRSFIWGAIRRNHSLSLAFRQAIESKNGQMSLTLIRLNLDTVARFYTLYWADGTIGMDAENFAKEVFLGKQIKDFQFQGAPGKAQDWWLINKIKPLAPWIENVYKSASGAIHFSDFHIRQVFDQSERSLLDDGSLLMHHISMNPIDTSEDPERFRELKQAFLHITLLLSCAADRRCEMLGGN
ncbi:hypothetical protein [Neotabrizicola sp. VNH66]|uniref:hypothetical protein n=1 Tax=Neotabrizicola sp. VNH66 TaxID=3400918 RepID=UPI003C08B412